ncbi:MAG: sodium:solute symporter [Bacteroidaceae bacterium]|nr:sodium:solute symporter [Bacteroidaceae bacterium]
MLVLISIILYFSVLLLLSRLVGKRGSNAAFFSGNRQSPWPLVAFGMIGASISGLTFIGVPGWVMDIDMTYLQMCMGFIVGYLIVAFVLLPLYYRLRLTSIYTYLNHRFGKVSYQTGSSFFIVSKILGAAAKFYVVCRILQYCLADTFAVPYAVVVLVALVLIWLYTRKNGIRALVWTDFMQTFCLLLALVLILMKAANMLGMDVSEAMTAVWNDSHSRIFEFNDFASKQNFWKQFFSGIFVVIVMTGLDQDMMQKNLTCKDLRSAQKDMCSYGVLFLPVNFLFLALGILLMMLYQQQGMALPEKGDDLLSVIVLNGTMGTACLIFFTIGIISSAFSSADSAMTALTTSFCIDILGKEEDEHTRKRVHFGMFVVFFFVTLAFDAIGSGSVMDLIYTLVSYTYGPLLGLFAFGLFTQRKSIERAVPYIAIASPAICYVIDLVVRQYAGYKFGYEMLMFNGLLTFIGLFLVSNRMAHSCQAKRVK